MFERQPGFNPEKNLWRNVLLVAVEDALLGPTQISGSHSHEIKIRLCNEARDYLTKPSADLAQVCALAGLDMQPVIEAMRKRIAAAPTPEELADQAKRQSAAAFTKAPAKTKPMPFIYVD